MGTAYITQEDAFIGKVDERLVVKVDKEKILDVPLIKIDGIVILGRATVSPSVIAELLDHHIPLSFLKVTGKYLGRLEPEMTKNIFLRKAQWQASPDSESAIHLVRAFVRGKFKNYRNSLLRRQRKYENLDLTSGLTKLEQAIASLDTTFTIDSLQGLEGFGSAAYFGCFNQLLKNAAFCFTHRNRRPPKDPINALLSLGYSLLRHDIQSAVNIVGFDPYLGYLHYQHYGRPGLALDLMEEFRPLVVDAVVLDAINHQLLSPNDFATESLSQAVNLSKDGLKTFLRVYEQKKQAEFKHPVLGRKCTYQEAFEIQARLIAKYLMEETDKYPPLILK